MHFLTEGATMFSHFSHSSASYTAFKSLASILNNIEISSVVSQWRGVETCAVTFTWPVAHTSTITCHLELPEANVNTTPVKHKHVAHILTALSSNDNGTVPIATTQCRTVWHSADLSDTEWVSTSSAVAAPAWYSRGAKEDPGWHWGGKSPSNGL